MPNANKFCMSLCRILLRFPPFGESGQVPFVHAIHLWYFPSRESTARKVYISEVMEVLAQPPINPMIQKH